MSTNPTTNGFTSSSGPYLDTQMTWNRSSMTPSPSPSTPTSFAFRSLKPIDTAASPLARKRRRGILDYDGSARKGQFCVDREEQKKRMRLQLGESQVHAPEDEPRKLQSGYLQLSPTSPSPNPELDPNNKHLTESSEWPQGYPPSPTSPSGSPWPTDPDADAFAALTKSPHHPASLYPPPASTTPAVYIQNDDNEGEDIDEGLTEIQWLRKYRPSPTSPWTTPEPESDDEGRFTSRTAITPSASAVLTPNPSTFSIRDHDHDGEGDCEHREIRERQWLQALLSPRYHDHEQDGLTDMLASNYRRLDLPASQTNGDGDRDAAVRSRYRYRQRADSYPGAVWVRGERDGERDGDVEVFVL